MSDIPDDIQRTANSAWNILPFSHVELMKDVTIGIIARAILTERERCAKIAEAYARNEEDDYLDPEFATGRNVTARHISEDIRTPSTPPEGREQTT